MQQVVIQYERKFCNLKCVVLHLQQICVYQANLTHTDLWKLKEVKISMFWKEKLHRLNCFAASFHTFLYCLLSFAADSDGRNSREQSRTDAAWFSRPHSTKGGPLKGSLVLCQYLFLKCSGFCPDFVLDFVLKLTHDYFRGRIVRRGPLKGSQVVLCQYPISGSSWLWKFYQHKRPSLRSHTWCCLIRASCPIMDIKRAQS